MEDQPMEGHPVEGHPTQDPPLENQAMVNQAIVGQPTVFLRCIGQTVKGKQCSVWTKVVVGTNAAEHPFCWMHSAFYKGASRSLLNCDGYLADRSICTKFVGHKDRPNPKLCPQHANQVHYIKFILCSGKRSDGTACTNYFRWTPPFPRFCDDHADQHDPSHCPILQLPLEMMSKVLQLLTPEDRVAFALASTEFHARAMNYAPRKELPPHLKKETLGKCKYSTHGAYPDGFSTAKPLHLRGEFYPRYGECRTFGFRHSGDDQFRRNNFNTPIEPWLRNDSYTAQMTCLFRVMVKHPHLFPLPDERRRCLVCGGWIEEPSTAVSWWCTTRAREVFPRYLADIPLADVPTHSSATLPDSFHVQMIRLSRRAHLGHATRVFCSNACRVSSLDVSHTPSSSIRETQQFEWLLARYREIHGHAENLVNFGADLLMNWCISCHGQPPPLAYARAFWATQREREVENEAAGGPEGSSTMASGPGAATSASQ